MTQNPFFNSLMKMDLGKMPANTPMDMRGIMELGRKNFQALTEAQQVAMESLQTIAQRQAEILSQIVQDQSSMVREIITEGTPEEKVARGADLIRKAYEKGIHGAREVSDMLNKSGREASDIINKRVASALNELKTTATESKEQRKAPKDKSAA